MTDTESIQSIRDLIASLGNDLAYWPEDNDVQLRQLAHVESVASQLRGMAQRLAGTIREQ